MRVTVISPERSLFDGEAAAVVAPAFDGQVGILPRHAPFMTLLGEGVLTVRTGGGGGGGGQATRFRLSGGFLQVAADTVRVVAGAAEPA
jgi:F-type H+-transporting ATPase subunit epsilon